MYRTSISSYSKAPWGLSVLMRVTCIFTGIKISPSPRLRQCPDHYTFRAGQNLPDKEFRYLRTVIVTAAAAPILLLSNLQKPMFLVNSCLGVFSVGHDCDHPLSRSYGVILPSSLTVVLSLTLGFSPWPPVSVLSTGIYIISPRSFSWKLGIRRFHCKQFHYHTSAYL